MMRRVLLILAAGTLTAFGAVDMTLHNTEPLVQQDGVTPLPGNSSGGSLVQVIFVGGDNTPDAPAASSGAPTGDDTLLFTTHVGAGLPLTDTGLLVQSSIMYNNALVGLSAYVRFWNAASVSSATYFGVSDLFNLPAGDVFDLAEFDFAPLPSSPHITNIPFDYTPLDVVPEPSSLFVIGMVILAWIKRRHGLTLLSVVTLTLATNVPAQELRRLDITASVGIRDGNGMLLAGSNPDVTGDSGGCLVQILDVGLNGVADLPALSGEPGGDDYVYHTTVIGKGIVPNVLLSGRFATTAFPAPPTDRRLYARVFDAPTIGAATRWGQSATFVVNGTTVMDLSVLGLGGTTQTVGVNPQLVDSDGDGRTDYEEMVANTNPLAAADALATGQFQLSPGLAGVTVDARAGRTYVLQRAENLTDWQDVGPTQSVWGATNLWLQDPNPPVTPKMFYRVRIHMP